MSIAGMSMSPEQTSATVYTDAYSILQHRNVVEMVLTSCVPCFQTFPWDWVQRRPGCCGNRGEPVRLCFPIFRRGFHERRRTAV